MWCNPNSKTLRGYSLEFLRTEPILIQGPDLGRALTPNSQELPRLQRATEPKLWVTEGTKSPQDALRPADMMPLPLVPGNVPYFLESYVYSGFLLFLFSYGVKSN